MVDFPIDTGIRKIGDSTSGTGLAGNEEWFGNEDITILLSNTNILATIVVDFAFSVPTVVEFTLNGDDGTPIWIAFNQGAQVTGGQSRFIDVVKDTALNFRATEPGDLIRCIVSSVP